MAQTYRKLLSLAFFAAFIFPLFSFDKVEPAKVKTFATPIYEELIILVPDANEKNIVEIRDRVLTNPGVTFSGFCKRLQVLMFVVDRSQQVNNAFMDEAMHDLGMGYEVKIGGTIAQVQTECGMSADQIQHQQ